MPFLLQLNHAITPTTSEILVLFVLLAATLRNSNSHILLREEKQAEILVETLIMNTEGEVLFSSLSPERPACTTQQEFLTLLK